MLKYIKNIKLMPLIFLLVNQAFLQNVRFEHLTIENGLSQNTINCIFQDSRGFMWFGTQDGLNKFDGYNFTIFRHDPTDTNSISHSWVWYIYEDSRNNIWIATWRGLTKYDPTINKFTRYLPDPNSPNSISGERPTSICEDENGFLWIGTWGGGLNRYDYWQDRFIHFKHNPGDSSSLADNFVRVLYRAKDGNIWAGTWNGLSRLNKSTKGEYSFINYQHDPANSESLSSNKITSIYEDKSEALWIGVFGGGLNQFKKSGNAFINYKHDLNNPGSLSNDDVSAIFEDSKGELWVGTVSGGVNKFNRKNNRFIHFRHDPDNINSLNGNKVYSIFEDKSGLLWIGANGINIYNRNLERFTHFSHKPNNSNTLSRNEIRAFHEDRKGNIWIGTEGGGLNKYNPRTKQFRIYKHNINDPFSIGNNNVSSIVEDKNGWLWIGTIGGGLNKYDPSSAHFFHNDDIQKMLQSEKMDYINTLCIDRRGILWIGVYDKGLIQYDIEHNQISHFMSDPDDKFSLSGNYILTIYEDSKEEIWIGGWGGGLCRYDRMNKRFIRFLHDPDNPNSLVDNIVHTIYESQYSGERILWIGTSGGLSYMKLSGSSLGNFSHIFTKDGLPSNVIYGILEDKSGNLWLSTNNGVCKFNPENMTFKNYNSTDGLQSNEFNARASLKKKNGQFLFGGINGFNSFYPDSIKENSFIPSIAFISFKIFDKPVKLNQSLNTIETIELSYRQNFFSFEFAALDFTRPYKNQYAYMMEGFDNDWIYSGDRRYASYTNLDPGSYTFRVKGTNSDGIWNKKGSSLNIIISPPFWQTLWFRVIAAIFLFSILYAFYKYRLSKLLEIERLRIRIASDLHDDIGSALTRIAIHSEQIQTSRDDTKVISASKKIGSLSRGIISTMSDIIWSIDARNDSIKDLIDRMHDFAHNTLGMQDVKVTFSHKGLDKNKRLPIDYRQNLFLIFKEAVNNIVKHARASEVDIQLINESKYFTMRISDNGEGFIFEQVKKGNGLINMKMRAERIGAILEVKSNNGVQLFIKMPGI